MIADKPVYNKWHETELERWLTDHNIPYPTPADRRDLENLVKENWDTYVVTPYNKWDTAQLHKYIAQRGEDLQGVGGQVMRGGHGTRSPSRGVPSASSSMSVTASASAGSSDP